jgi:uncharacterized membrane protein
VPSRQQASKHVCQSVTVVVGCLVVVFTVVVGCLVVVFTVVVGCLVVVFTVVVGCLVVVFSVAGMQALCGGSHWVPPLSRFSHDSPAPHGSVRHAFHV